jgi:NADPH2:quinone reductase
MRAAMVETWDGPTAIRLEDVPDPVPAAGEVLIDVRYAGVVFPDVLNTRGEYQQRPDLPFAPGWDVAGVVRQSSGQFRAGDRLAAMPLVGGFAERVAVSSDMVFPVPDHVPLSTAAALPLNYLTMHFALQRRARLQAGETVLVQGAGGGLGAAACQLAAAYGARVVAVASTPSKATVARAMGAHEVVGVNGFRDAVRDLTEGSGVDVIVDPVGGDRFTDSLRCLAPEGRLLVMGFTGRSIPTVKVNRLLLTNTAVLGAASEEFWVTHPDYPRQQWTELLPLIESGAVSPVISDIFDLADAALALTALDERRAAGRVLIEIGNSGEV